MQYDDHNYQQNAPERQEYPTPQTTSHPVIRTTPRVWRLLSVGSRSPFLLLSGIIATIYFIAKIIDAILLYNSIETVAASVAITADSVFRAGVREMFFSQLPTMHYIAFTLAFALNWVAWLTDRPWAALACTALYFISAIAYIRWTLFILPEILLSLLGYFATMRRYNSWY